jgi:hypothetical protein
MKTLPLTMQGFSAKLDKVHRIPFAEAALYPGR